jgi:glycosyltransferase 2 family protein
LKKRLLSIAKYLFFLGLGVLLVWLSVKDFTEKDKEDFFHAISIADYSWIVLSIFLGILSHISRAVRWRMLLKPLNHEPSTRNTFFAVMVGYLANFAFPRLGEVTRCGVLSRYEKIPFEIAFGTVIAERTVDFLCLVLIFIITLIAEFEKLYGLAYEHILHPVSIRLTKMTANTYLMISILAFILVIAAVIFLYRKKIAKLFTGKVKAIFLGFWQGLISIGKLQKPWQFIAHTIFIWTMYYLMLHVCFFSFEETKSLGIGPGMAVLIMGALGVMFTQGGIGAYQFLVTITLTSSLALIPQPVASAFSWIVWASQFFCILIVGVISLILLPILNKENLKSKI